MFTLRITGLDSPGPIELEPFEGEFWDVEPLNHAQLTRYMEFTKAGEHAFEVKVTNAARILPDKTREGPLTARITVTSNAKSLLFGLVDGGWVPFPYASGDTVFIDNNVIIRIEKLRKENFVSSPGQASQHIEPHDGLELAGQTVSPLPFVLEGSQRRLQSHSELQGSLARATKVLRRVLPEARVHSPAGDQLEGLKRLLGDLTRYQQKANPFLQSVCHSVAQPAGLKQRTQVETKILNSARAHGIKAKSLVVLAVISCLYDHAPGIPASAAHRPGRAVLKPKLVYREEMAYAALLDLLFLELLTGMQALGASKKPVFYTHDLGLAAFWAALEPRGFQLNDQRFPTGNIRLTPALCPALTEDECDQLLLRLDEHDLLAA